MTTALAAMRPNATLLELAQVYWFERVLDVSPEGGVRRVDPEVYFWARPKTSYDGYPNLATCTWPG